MNYWPHWAHDISAIKTSKYEIDSSHFFRYLIQPLHLQDNTVSRKCPLSIRMCRIHMLALETEVYDCIQQHQK